MVELYYTIRKILALFYKHSHIAYPYFSFTLIHVYILILAHSSLHVYSNLLYKKKKNFTISMLKIMLPSSIQLS